MGFDTYNPVADRLVALTYADDEEELSAATTNVSLEQLADGIAWNDDNRVPEFKYVRLDDHLFTTADPTWSVLPDSSTTTHAACAVGDIIQIDIRAWILVGANGGAAAQIIRVVAIDDASGTPATTELWRRRMDASSTLHVEIGVHVFHTVTAAGTTRIRVEGSNAGVGTYSLELEEDSPTGGASHQRTMRFRA